MHGNILIGELFDFSYNGYCKSIRKKLEHFSTSGIAVTGQKLKPFRTKEKGSLGLFFFLNGCILVKMAHYKSRDSF